MLGKNYFNQRYIKNEIGWHIGEPSTPIITYINQVKNKDYPILVPGTGDTKAEYTRLFDNKFNLATIEDCHNSVKTRLGNKLFIKFIRK